MMNAIRCVDLVRAAVNNSSTDSRHQHPNETTARNMSNINDIISCIVIVV